MNFPEGSFNMSCPVRFSDIDAHGRASIQSIFNYLQEAADGHTQKLGITVDRLLKLNITWVLSRFHLRIQKYPLWRDEVTIVTWPSRMQEMFAIREFQLLDSQHAVIGEATSSWMIIDVKERRPVKFPEMIQSINIASSQRAIDDPFQKLRLPDSIDYESTFTVRFDDLDMNWHANAARYLTWISESLPFQLRQTSVLNELEISYRAETRYGDSINALVQRTDSNEESYLHLLIRQSDSKEIAIARTCWKPIE
ncbi:hypothetical protein JW979_02870 [bacterium]|nr:hypothetical protein [candidate division CSSED10-310 bacterium]